MTARLSGWESIFNAIDADVRRAWNEIETEPFTIEDLRKAAEWMRRYRPQLPQPTTLTRRLARAQRRRKR